MFRRGPSWSSGFLALAVSTALLATSCDSASHPRESHQSARPVTPSERPGPLASEACRNPNAEVKTGSSKPVQIGALSFAIFPYDPPYPTKMLIRADQSLSSPVALVGASCSNGERLRFWYRTSDGGLPSPLDRNPGEGDLIATLPPGGSAYTGYALLTHPGAWGVSISSAHQPIGALLIAARAVQR